MCKKHGNRSQASILVVDNDRSNALTLSSILVGQGYEVATAFSGREAIALAAGFSPDLLVSEVCIAEMSGVEVAARVVEMAPHCSVLFLSGLASMNDALNEAPEHLIYSFTSKPLHPLDFQNAVAYMPAAVITEHDSPVMVANHGNPVSHAVTLRPAQTGLIFTEA